MNRTQLINLELKSFRTPKYLEIGVRNGENFFAVNARYKFGVDPSYFFAKRALFRAIFFKRNWHFKMFKMTSDVFFSKLAPKITSNKAFDLVLIDGLHTYEQSLSDAVNSLSFLNRKGTIIFHDCNPTSLKAAQPSIPDENINWNGEVWKTIYHFRKYPECFQCFTYDTDEGIGILRLRSGCNKIPNLARPSIEIKNLPYSHLDTNRAESIGLRKVPSSLQTNQS